jgi:phosphoribosylformimino-5-aminoimidazole carboxamide ribotide isomerase
MAFEVIPAIDLLGGRCVRLLQGRFDAVTVYAEDPAALARDFAARGAARLHVVDLDGARAGEPREREAVRRIVAAAGGACVQLGGGLRRLEAVEESLALGVERVVLGTAALRDPDLVRDAARRFPGRVAVGLDAREGRVAAAGWLESSEAPVEEVARRFEGAGVAALVHTDIARDGTLEGPNLEASARLAEVVGIPVIASGGVGSEADVRAAAALAARGLAGLIVGRALYTGAVRLERALAIAACC